MQANPSEERILKPVRIICHFPKIKILSYFHLFDALIDAFVHQYLLEFWVLDF